MGKMVYVYYVTTALGHEVPAGDWQAVHSDAILKILHDRATRSPAPSQSGPSLLVLASATGLAVDDVRLICEALVAQGLVEPRGESYATTPTGMAFVQNALASALW